MLYPLGGSFQVGKAIWTLSQYLPTKNADYCMLVNEWAWLSSRVCLIEAESALGFSFGASSDKLGFGVVKACIC